MNKYQEALEIAYEMMNQADWGSMKIGCNQLKILQELVDKETPKKPIIKNVCNEVDGDVDYGACPNCEYPLDYGFNYCPNCGQRLDWEVKDENAKKLYR